MGPAPPARSRQTPARFVVLVVLMAAAVPVVAAASFSGRTGGVFGRGTGVAPGGRGKAIPSGWRRDRAAPRDKKKTSKAEGARDVRDAAAANRVASARGRVGAHSVRVDRAVPATETVDAADPGVAPPPEREPAAATAGTAEPKAPVPNVHRKARGNGAGDLDQVLAAAARLRRQHEMQGDADAYNGAGSVVAPPEERVDLSYLVRPSAAALEATNEADADDVGVDRAPSTAASAEVATTSDSTPGTPDALKTPASASREEPAASESPPALDTAPGPVTKETAPDDVPPSRRESSIVTPATGATTDEIKPSCRDPADDVGRRADLPPTPPPDGIVTPPEGLPSKQDAATVVEDTPAAPTQPPTMAPEDSATQSQPSPDAAPGADSPRKPAPAKKVTDVSIAAIKRAAAEAKRRQQEREAAEAKALEEARKARRAEADALMAKDAAAAADIPVADHGAPSDKDQPALTTSDNTPTTPPQSKEDL